jgi:biopolymer transport protein ExbD
MRRRRERNPRLRSSAPTGGGVNLISMMDVLTVLLLFLLKSYVAGGEVIVPPPGIQLPASTAEQLPQTSLVVAIDDDEILVGSEPVTTVSEALGSDDLEIAALAERLRLIAQQQDEIARARGESPAESRAATIQGDRGIEFRVLQRVMYTLNKNGYQNVALAVLQKS